MKTPIIETERLILRPLQLTDAQEVFNNWASDPEVATFMVWSTHKDIEVTKAWLAELANTVDSDSYDWGFVCDGQYSKIDGSAQFECKFYVLEI